MLLIPQQSCPKQKQKTGKVDGELHWHPQGAAAARSSGPMHDHGDTTLSPVRCELNSGSPKARVWREGKAEKQYISITSTQKFWAIASSTSGWKVSSFGRGRHVMCGWMWVGLKRAELELLSVRHPGFLRWLPQYDLQHSNEGCSMTKKPAGRDQLGLMVLGTHWGPLSRLQQQGNQGNSSHVRCPKSLENFWHIKHLVNISGINEQMSKWTPVWSIFRVSGDRIPQWEHHVQSRCSQNYPWKFP